jgi:hypothetical protein
VKVGEFLNSDEEFYRYVRLVADPDLLQGRLRHPSRWAHRLPGRNGTAVIPTQRELRSVNADDNYSMYRERFSTRSRLQFLRLAGLRL